MFVHILALGFLEVVSNNWNEKADKKLWGGLEALVLPSSSSSRPKSLPLLLFWEKVEESRKFLLSSPIYLFVHCLPAARATTKKMRANRI